MNIFILDEDPAEAARQQCDKHVVKMIVESAQMLSTAHRMLDGYKDKRLSKSGKRMVNYWVHPNKNLENTLYKAVHHNHPCTVWTMESSANYNWHYQHFIALCTEYQHRYNKIHSTQNLLEELLLNKPNNIPSKDLTPFALAMKHEPQCIHEGQAVRSYRLYYQTKLARMPMVWSYRPTPEWFLHANIHS